MPYNRNSIKPYFIIVIASVLLYTWQSHLYPMINPDGVTYIEAAAAYLKGGFRAALTLGDQAKWPFYSILIAMVHSLTGLPLLTAQEILDVTFIGISAGLFLHLVRLFSGHRHAGIWGIIIWLTWHGYVKWWPVIVRDHGFLTCLLLSFYCYYRYTLTHRVVWALAWALCMVVAELFRIEAVMYLALIPFSVFFGGNIKWRCRFILWLKLNIFPLLAGVCVAVLFFNKTLTLDSLRFDYMQHEFSFFFSTLRNEFMQRYQIFHRAVFYRENDFSAHALLISYGVVFLCYLLSQVSLAVVLPIFLMKKSLARLNLNLFWQSFLPYFSLAFAIPLFFFAEHVFLNGRYLLPFGLFVLLLIASVLPNILETMAGKKKYLFLGVTGVLLAINLSTNLVCFGRVNQDEFVIGKWLKAHYPHQTIYTNNKGILFYDSESPDYKNGEVHEIWYKGTEGAANRWLKANEEWCHYDLLVIVAPEDKALEQRSEFKWLERQKAIGPITKSFKRSFQGGYALVAPIFSSACMAMVAKSQEEKLQATAKNS